VALALVVAGLTGLTLSSTAAAGSASGTPCAKKILGDWYDNGRIDRLYPLHCYEEAIDAIPPDIRDYVDARDVIERALQAAVNGKLAPGGPDPTPGENGRGLFGPGEGPDSGAGGTEATPNVNTGGPSSVPIPLVVLGGMSLALLAAGGLGYVARRRQAAADDDLDDTPDDDPLE
jgi:hypothetical protein